MSGITTILFDFDGVITNTEPQYDDFFAELNEKLHLGIDDFAESLKGKRLTEALEILYPQLGEKVKEEIISETFDFELSMDYPLVPGVMDFINDLKTKGFKLGLVTSSHEAKMRIAMTRLHLNGIFDTEVMAGRITKGKPDPMCYLLAAEDLKSSPAECIVFEDSLAGIQSGSSAGMKVVGVSTTIDKAELLKLTPEVIPDFTDLNYLQKLL